MKFKVKNVNCMNCVNLIKILLKMNWKYRSGFGSKILSLIEENQVTNLQKNFKI